MQQKIYCSQCHNSVYTATAKATSAQSRFGTDKICLYCYKQKKFMHKDQRINGFVHLDPESAAKLNLTIWSPNKYGK